MAADTGTGTTIVFGTSGWTGQVIEVGWDGIDRESIETSHLGTIGGKTFMPGDNYDPGEITLEISFDGDETPPITAVAETITVTFPKKIGVTTAGNWAASGFVTGFSFGLPYEGKQTGSMTIKLTGDHTYTASI